MYDVYQLLWNHHHILIVTGHHLNSAKSDNAYLGWENQGTSVGPTNGANVTDADCSSHQLASKFSLLAQIPQSLQLEMDIPQVKVLAIFDVGHHKSLRRVKSNWNIVTLMLLEFERRVLLILNYFHWIVGGINNGILGECHGESLDEEAHESEREV